MLNRSVNELLYPGKVENGIELAIHFPLSHSQNCAIEINVFPAGKLGMESSPDFQQAGYPALEPNAANCRFSDAAQDFQKRGFSRSISANDSDCFARFHTKREV